MAALLVVGLICNLLVKPVGDGAHVKAPLLEAAS